MAVSRHPADRARCGGLRREIAAAPSSGRGADYRWLYLAVVLVTLWFAIGPPYGVWRWVYWLPGLNFVRVPSRFMLLGVLGLGVLAGLGFDRLDGRAARRSSRHAPPW